MRGVPILLLLLLAACAPPQPAAPAPAPAAADHVLLISIDGLRPDFYLDAKYEAPTLRRLATQGAHAGGVVSVFPSVTYPSHATIVTGVYPDRHGVLSNTRWTKKGPVNGWYWEATDIRAPPIWRTAAEAGKSSAIVYWPSSVGAKVDWLIPEKWGGDKRELLTRISTPGLIKAIEAEYEAYDPKDENDKIYGDRYMTQSCAFILKKHKPNLMLLHLLQVDAAQHHEGREHAEVRDAVKRVDAHVAELLEALKEAGIREQTAVVITGDHGFINVDRSIAPNVLFRDEGWYRGPEDWDVVAHTSGAQAAIYVRGDDALKKKVGRLLEENRLQDGKPVYEIVDRAALTKLHAVPGAAFALSGLEGFTFAKQAIEREFLGPTSMKGNHGPLPDHPQMHTGLILYGPGVKSGARVKLARLVDVAPTIAQLLGLTLEEVEGKALSGLLE